MPTNKSLIAKDVKKLRKNIKRKSDKTQLDEEKEEESEGYASLKAFVLLLCLYGFGRLSGNSPISFYIVDVILDKLNSPAGLPISPKLLAPFIGSSELIGSILSIYLIDRFGRVLLLIISGIGMTITLGLTSVACYVIENATS